MYVLIRGDNVLFSPRMRTLRHRIGKLLSSLVALAGVALVVLISEYRGRCLAHGTADIFFLRYKFQPVLLARLLTHERLVDLFVLFAYRLIHAPTIAKETPRRTNGGAATSRQVHGARDAGHTQTPRPAAGLRR